MNSKNFMPLAALLVIASFLVGTQWPKVLSGKTNTANVASPQASADAQTPSQPKVLGVSEIASLVKGGQVLGSKDAKVTVVEFSDPSCPFCAAANGADIGISDGKGNSVKIISEYLQKNNPSWEAPGPKLEQLAKDGKIQLVFRYYPGHGTGEKAMQAAWCVADQNSDKFWPYLNSLFENQASLANDETLSELATKIGVDGSKVLSCANSGANKTRLQADVQAAQEAAKIASGKEGFGTPTFFVNGQMIVGAQSAQTFDSLIQKALQ